jgi:hypothetical protein
MVRKERIEQEVALLRQRFPRLEQKDDWIRLPDYPLPPGWNRDKTDVVFFIPPPYPGSPPYGFFVPIGLRCGSNPPGSYKEPAKETVPFDGQWGKFSWTPEDGQWLAKEPITAGRNLLNWTEGIASRFRGVS